MNSVRPFSRAYTLIELMVAMAVGVVVLGALVTLLVETNQANRVSTGVARMQENARFALDLMARELRSAMVQHCSAYDNRFPEAGFNTGRAIRVHADGLMPHGLPDRNSVLPPHGLPANSSEPYLLSPRYFLQGHECGATACQPLFTQLGSDGTVPPAIGAAAGLRPARSDVLTFRYLAQEGVTVVGSVPVVIPGTPPTIRVPLATAPDPDPLAVIDFQAGDLVMISNCSNAEVVEAVAAGLELELNDSGDNGAVRTGIRQFSQAEDARVVNFTRGFRTVSYFLRNRADPDQPGRLIPVLVRQVNGVAEELVEGIERLDFRYVVEDAFNNQHVLTADQVDAGVSGGGVPLQCLPPPDGLLAQEPGCLWRSVSAIEIGLLANSVDNVLSVAAPNYTYAFEGLVDAPVTTPMPHGLPPEFVLRREFRTTVALRTYNH